jgi:tartrate-resistant acid phosphatase type 5
MPLMMRLSRIQALLAVVIASLLLAACLQQPSTAPSLTGTVNTADNDQPSPTLSQAQEKEAQTAVGETESSSPVPESNKDDRFSGVNSAALIQPKDLATAPQYHLALKVDYPLPTFSGLSEVIFTNEEQVPLDSLYFRLYPNGKKSYGNGWLKVAFVQVNGQPAQFSLSDDESVLEIPLPTPLLPGEQNRLAFAFNGQVADGEGKSGDEGYGIYTLSQGVLTLSGWFPMLAVYDQNGWHLDPVSSMGDSVFADAAFYTVDLTVPQDLVVAATGVETARQAGEGMIRQTFTSGPARDFVLSMSPDFQVASQVTDGTTVTSYYLPEDAAGGKQVLQTAVNALQVFNDRFGAYPYTELDLVETPLRFALGVEYPGLVLIDQDQYDRVNDPVFISTISHETAHQWWYNTVGNDVFNAPWLDEGLATYSTGLFYEGEGGSQAYGNYFAAIDQPTATQYPITGSLSYFEGLDDASAYSQTVYFRAALFFRALRERIGDQAFFNAIQLYYRQNQFAIADNQDLLGAFEQAAGSSLEDFFSEWLNSAPENSDATALPTAAETSPAISFAVIGDYGSGNADAQAVAELVKRWKPDFILTVGDNNYPTGSAETIDFNVGQFYADYIAPYRGSFGTGGAENAFFPTLGNHDWDTNNAGPYLKYFTLPGNERYYDFTWGPVHFFALDGDYREPDGVGSSSRQADWLKQSLAASTAPWKIVYGHHPPYSSGHHGSIDWMRWPFKEWGATIYLAGHDHTYERLEIDGFPYIINGLGGGAIYQFKDVLPGSLVRYNAGYGALLVIADEQTLTFQFVTIEGDIIDTFTLNRQP